MAETIPGGYYIGSDGKPHDANGNPIEEDVLALTQAEGDPKTKSGKKPKEPSGKEPNPDGEGGDKKPSEESNA